MNMPWMNTMVLDFMFALRVVNIDSYFSGDDD